jgi:polar amino acid transport system substrate-binding protein
MTVSALARTNCLNSWLSGGLCVHFQSALNWYRVVLCLVIGCAINPALAQDWSVGFAENEPPISDGGPNGASGILPELTQLLFTRLPEESVSMLGGPWIRMQRSVEAGQLDGFVTYPSEDRKTYALFSETPLYHIDFGYLIYRRDHTQRERFEQARSFDDLSGLVFIGQQGAEWERDNIPSSFETVLLGHTDTMMHMLVRRRAGDFMVMPAEQAVEQARRFGYDDQIVYQPVGFMPNARIPFHVGIRRSHPEASDLLGRVDTVLSSQQYNLAVEKVLSKYR